LSHGKTHSIEGISFFALVAIRSIIRHSHVIHFLISPQAMKE
jgi:hypothetical protein